MPERAAPRLLTRAQLRCYLGGLDWSAVSQRIANGRIPGPLWGLAPTDPAARWDRRAVDRALDAASSIPASIEDDARSLDRALGLI
ncbi:hypothetical protein SAMN02745194_04511 [Roseomonas rosea]|uniref:Transcriptional regulator, AlpA family n=1 Tax=Muricoccus roseus TaxID=198092 RepID=A0A1M6QUA2_9PROT|nr:hypothetical protein [Roseomonas rosea]SHK23597.1 hypothetical protein SAMN02745194_04511 [Roseomonas rosea]